MIDFLIKSAASLLVWLLAYHLLLARENFYRFNRFYLLGALGFSMLLPLFSFEIDTPAVGPVPHWLPLQPLPMTAVRPTAPTIEIPWWWIGYGVITAVLVLRFVGHLVQFFRQMRKSPGQPYGAARLVLLDEPTPPHSFLDRIFVQKNAYENQQIEPELLVHELAHVRQHHTLDILLVEALRTVLWFNPLLYFYKKAIQLNHEFLADQAVLQDFGDIPAYQRLLLSKAAPLRHPVLASGFPYIVTKKRFHMMTLNTPVARALLKKFVLLPVGCGLVLLCCATNSAQTTPVATPKMAATFKGNPKDDATRDRYYAGVQIRIDDRIKKVWIDAPYEQLTTEQKREYLWYVPDAIIAKTPTEKEMQPFGDGKKYAVWLDGKRVTNAALLQHPRADIAYYSGSSVLKNARTKKNPQPFQYWFFTQKYYEANLKNAHMKYGSDVYTATLFKEDAEAQFPGGMGEFMKFFAKNYQYPAGFKGEVKLVVSFVVDSDGSLKDIKVLKEPVPGTAAEAVRVLKLSPQWSPAIKKGKPVRSDYTLPIVLRP